MHGFDVRFHFSKLGDQVVRLSNTVQEVLHLDQRNEFLVFE